MRDSRVIYCDPFFFFFFHRVINRDLVELFNAPRKRAAVRYQTITSLSAKERAHHHKIIAGQRNSGRASIAPLINLYTVMDFVAIRVTACIIDTFMSVDIAVCVRQLLIIALLQSGNTRERLFARRRLYNVTKSDDARINFTCRAK